MRYIITVTVTDENGNQTMNTMPIDATDARTAHNVASKHATDGATIRVYPDTTTAAGLARGALMVARRTAVNAVQRCGTPTQCRMEREFAAANARCVGAETAERIIYVMQEYSADTQDFFGVAMQGLIDGRAAGLDISEQYHGAFLTLNKFVHAQRAATDYEISAEFIIDGGGDIVAYNGAIASIIRGGDKWTAAAGANMDAATAARLGAALHDAIVTLSPTQREIVRMLAAGLSQRQIASKTGRAVSTVAQNIALIRQKVAAYMDGGEFSEVAHAAESRIENSKVNAAKTATKHHDAEYYRQYRAHKAAERAAVKNQ